MAYYVASYGIGYIKTAMVAATYSQEKGASDLAFFLVILSSIGVPFGLVWLNRDGDSWLAWWFIHLGPRATCFHANRKAPTLRESTGVWELSVWDPSKPLLNSSLPANRTFWPPLHRVEFSEALGLQT